MFYPKISIEKHDLARKRFIIVLADTGMGKTAFMVNLCLNYIKKRDRRFKTLLFPFVTKDLDSKIERIEDKKNVILLLDGLDEDPLAIKDPEARRLDLLAKVQEFRKVIITCRSQFFFHEDFEWKNTDTIHQSTKLKHTFGKVFISPFNNQDIHSYLSKNYAQNRDKYERALKIISRIPYLMARPIILKYIDSFVDKTINYNYTFEVYEVIVNKWIEREQFNIPDNNKEGFYNNMMKFSVEIAKYFYERPGSELKILSNDIDHFAKENEISLSALELKNKSLLNRGEKNYYKFAHKSIMEYFLSISLYKNELSTNFSKQGYDAAVLFYRERCFKFHTMPFLNNLFGNGIKSVSHTIGAVNEFLHSLEGIDIKSIYIVPRTISPDMQLNWLPFAESISEVHISNPSILGDWKIFIPMKKLRKIVIKNCLIPYNLEFMNFLNIDEIILENSTLTEDAVCNIKKVSETKILNYL